MLDMDILLTWGITWTLSLTEYGLFGQKLFKQITQASTSQVEEVRISTKVVLDYFIILIIMKLISILLTIGAILF
jgi:hypothetical protein